jgi:hypothetical protein
MARKISLTMPRTDPSLPFTEINLEGTRYRMCAMSLQRFQPEIPFDEALRLVNFKTQTKVANAVYEAWTEANKVKFDKDSAAGPQ